jgi:hypothetical protein
VSPLMPRPRAAPSAASVQRHKPPHKRDTHRHACARAEEDAQMWRRLCHARGRRPAPPRRQYRRNARARPHKKGGTGAERIGAPCPSHRRRAPPAGNRHADPAAHPAHVGGKGCTHHHTATPIAAATATSPTGYPGQHQAPSANGQAANAAQLHAGERGGPHGTGDAHGADHPNAPPAHATNPGTQGRHPATDPTGNRAVRLVLMH